MHATRLACLHDGVEYTINLELLAAALMTNTERPASWPMLQAEREALLRNDIPSFGARTDGTALLLEDGGRSRRISGRQVTKPYWKKYAASAKRIWRFR